MKALSIFALGSLGLISLLAIGLRDRQSPPLNPAILEELPLEDGSSAVDGFLRQQARLAEQSAGANITAPLSEALEVYWGSLWPTIKQELQAKGVDLSMPFELEPWEKSAPSYEVHFRITESKRAVLWEDYYGWPEALDLETAQERWGDDLTETDVYELEALARPFNDTLLPMVDEYLLVLDQTLREVWQREMYEKAPYTLAESQKGMRPMFKAAGITGQGGWAVSYRLSKDDFPYLGDLQGACTAHGLQRDSAINKYLKGKRG